MDDDEYRTVVSRDVLVRQGTAAIVDLVGGIAFLVMAMGARFRFLGIVVSLAVLVVGIGALISRYREDKKPGIVITAAGVLGMVNQFGLIILRPFSGFILGLGGLFLLAGGVWKGIKFLLGLKSRQ